MTDEGIEISNEGCKGHGGVPTLDGMSVASGIPGEHGKAGKFEFVDYMRKTAGVFMPAMQEDDCAARRRSLGRPVTIEQPDTIAGLKEVIFMESHLIHAVLASARPLRTRLTIVSASRKTINRGKR